MKSPCRSVMITQQLSTYLRLCGLTVRCTVLVMVVMLSSSVLVLTRYSGRLGWKELQAWKYPPRRMDKQLTLVLSGLMNQTPVTAPSHASTSLYGLRHGHQTQTRSARENNRIPPTIKTVLRVNQTGRNATTAYAMRKEVVRTLSTHKDSSQTNLPLRSVTLNYETWATTLTFAQCLPALAKSKESILCCLKRFRKSIPVGLSQQDQVVLEKAGFEPSFIKALPHTDLPRFGSCAVVSSASSLKKHKFGKEIDSHDAVFRFNDAPTSGFEDIVGSKTTVRVINSQVQKKRMNGKVSLKGLIPDSKTAQARDVIFFVRDTPKDSDMFSKSDAQAVWNSGPHQVIKNYLSLRQGGYEGYLNHPVFAALAAVKLLKLFGLKVGYSSSSGFQGVLLATLLCDSVTSYEVDTDDVASRTTGYYFRSSLDRYFARNGYKVVHPIKEERTVLSKLGTRRTGCSVYEIKIADATCN